MIIEAKEQEKVIKQELQQKKWKKADPNAKYEAALYNPSMPTTDDTEDSGTWKERWLKDTRTRQVEHSAALLESAGSFWQKNAKQKSSKYLVSLKSKLSG
jgi:hypothetical protein